MEYPVDLVVAQTVIESVEDAVGVLLDTLEDGRVGFVLEILVKRRLDAQPVQDEVVQVVVVQVGSRPREAGPRFGCTKARRTIGLDVLNRLGMDLAGVLPERRRPRVVLVVEADEVIDLLPGCMGRLVVQVTDA